MSGSGGTADHTHTVERGSSAVGGHAPDAAEQQDRSTERVGWIRSAGVVGPGVVAMTVLALIGLTASDAWMDEACSLAATVQFREVLERTSGTMAAYYGVLNGWIAVSDSLWWVRSLSVVFAAVAIVVTGLVAVRARGVSVARWACLLLGVSFMVVRYAREARSFTMVLVVVGAAWLALDHILEGGPHRNRWTVAHLALSCLVPLVHGLAIIPLLAQGIALLVSGASRRAWVRAVPGFVASVVVVGLLYRMGASDVGAGGGLTFDGAERVLLRLNGGLRWSEVPWFDLRLVVLAATAYGMVLAVGRWHRATNPLDRYRAVHPAIWAAATIGGLFVLSAVRPQLVDRYAIAAVPAIAILQADAAVHLQRLAGRLARGWGRRATVPLVPLLLAAVVFTGQLPLQQRTSHPWTEMVDLLATEARSGDGLLVPRGSGRLMLDYAWSQHDGALPDVVSVSPTHPLGRVQRFGSRLELDDAVARAGQFDRLWVLQVPLSSGDTAFRDAMYHPGLAWVFDVRETHRFGAGTLLLLERAG